MRKWSQTPKAEGAAKTKDPKTVRWFVGLVALSSALILAGTAPANELGRHEPVKVYVAASTRDAVDAIAREFERESGWKVEVSPGPSSKLAKQIREGAPADLFLSADQANADFLAEKGLVAQRRNLLSNRLIVVTPSDSSLELTSLADLTLPEVKELALAVEKVPAGEYAREALRNAAVWDKVRSKVVGGEDVRATLAFVEAGASAGVVYRSDATGNSKVRVAFEVDSSLHRPIEYPLSLIRHEKPNPGAIELYEYLGSERAAERFRRAKFQVLSSD